MGRILSLWLLLSSVFFVSLVGGYELGISPPSLYFDSRVGEEVCGNVSVFVSGSEQVVFRDYWSEEESKMIQEYTGRGEELGVRLRYESLVHIVSNRSVLVCFSAASPGEYYGLLMAEGAFGRAGVGSWIVARVSGEEEVFTRNVVENGKGRVYGLGGVSVILVFILAVLVYVSRRRKKKFI